MKTLITIILAMIIVPILSVVYIESSINSMAHAATTGCPDGQYLQGYGKDNGLPVCINPPLGCPYAEQLTMEDPKCVPPAITPYTASTVAPTPVATPSIINNIVPMVGK